MAVSFDSNPTTELEALNLALLSIGKSPVNTTAVPGVNDISNFMTVFYDTVRQLQSRAWWFNFDTKYPITPGAGTVDGSNVTGAVARPQSCIDFYPTRRNLPLVERQNFLWDLRAHTFTIPPQHLEQDGTLHCDVTWCFTFTDLPQTARNAAFGRAARVFQAGAIGSQLIYQFTKERELDAYAELERSHLRNSGTNMFAAPTRNSRISNRQPNAYYRFGV